MRASSESALMFGLALSSKGRTARVCARAYGVAIPLVTPEEFHVAGKISLVLTVLYRVAFFSLLKCFFSWSKSLYHSQPAPSPHQ